MRHEGRACRVRRSDRSGHGVVGRHAELGSGLAPLVASVQEVAFDPVPPRGMTGSGLALVNAPHGADSVFAAALAQAAPVLVPA